MSETIAPAPSGAAPAAPAQGQPAARPHHAATQPREQGRFAGPPDPSKAPSPGAGAPTEPGTPAPPLKPKTWKLGDREVSDPDELYAIATQSQVDYEAFERAQREAEELRQYRERLKKDRSAVFQTPEEKRAFAIETLRREIEEQTLTPEEREYRKAQRERQELQERLAALEKEKQDKEQAELDQRYRQQFVSIAKEAMTESGLPLTDENLRRLTRVMRQNLSKGLNYPPVVLARQVLAAREKELSGEVDSLDPQALLKRLPGLLKKLDSVEDPELLKAIHQAAPRLGERLRLLNLQGMGAAPLQAPKPAAGSAPSAPSTSPHGAPHDAKYARLMSKRQEEWDWRDHDLAANLRLKGYSIPG